MCVSVLAFLFQTYSVPREAHLFRLQHELKCRLLKIVVRCNFTVIDMQYSYYSSRELFFFGFAKFTSFCSLLFSKDCVQLNQYKLKDEIGKVF